MSDDVLLLVEGLHKQFGGVTAVEGLSFSIAKGQTFGLIGPNGSGKTTTINIIAGQISPDRGSVRLAGRGLVGLRPDQVCREGVARTFQNLELFPSLDLFGHALLGAHRHARSTLIEGLFRMPRLRRDERECRRRAVDALQRFPERLTPDRWHDKAATLSYANRRRLEIVRAMASEPRLLLLDEPTAGMNPHERLEMIGHLRELQAEGVSMLIIEHAMEVVRALCSEVIVMDHGEVIGQGEPEEVVGRPEIVEAYLGT